MSRALARPYPETGPRGQHRGTTHAITACDNQGVTHLTFMGKGVAAQQSWTDIILFKKRIIGINLRNTFLTESDVEHFQTSDKWL